MLLTRGPVVLALPLALLPLTSCSTDPPITTVGVAETSTVVWAPIIDVNAGDCLAGTAAAADEVPTVPCETVGAIPVLGIGSVDAGAPAARPAEAVVNGYAIAACEEFTDSWAMQHERPATGLMQVAVAPDVAWDGPGTSVLCGVVEVA